MTEYTFLGDLSVKMTKNCIENENSAETLYCQ